MFTSNPKGFFTRLKKHFPVTTAIALIGVPAANACLWDYDTLAMERRRFPGAHELIVGHFLRHSPAYYQWRIKDRSKKPESDRSPQDYDDIAVAYEKLGQHEKAIATIEDKIKRWPDEGRYESEANLGTFLIHAGRLNEGLGHVKAAIKINPDAHFGREVFQQLLVEYVIERREAGATLPLDESLSEGPYHGFVEYVRYRKDYDDLGELVRHAIKGVLGMMRFGNHESPILLEALGDLLLYHYYKDSKTVAARAYLQAARHVKDQRQARAYLDRVGVAMYLQTGWNINEVASDLKAELRQAERLYAGIAARENEWIAAGKNLDEEFANTYYSAPPLQLKNADRRRRSRGEKTHRSVEILLAALLILPASAWFAIRRYRRYRNRS